MSRQDKTRARVPVLLGTALTLSLAHGATAATEIDLQRDAVSGLNEQCRALAEDIRARNNRVPDDMSQRIVEALNNDRANACRDAISALARAPGEEGMRTGDDATMTDEARAQSQDSATETARDSETAEIDETVEVEQEATIEGQAAVRVPEPNVDVEVDGPQVTVRKAQPQVTVDEQPATIQVEQPQPEVAVEIPEIVVRVEVPAPTIYIQSDAPNVQVASADPQVDVEQSEPRVTVTQPDPEVTVDLGVDEETQQQPGDATDPSFGTGQASTDSADDGDVNRGGDVQVASSTPRVEIVQPEGEPNFSINRAEPQVEYSSAEPNVSVSFAEQPSVAIVNTGEPRVTFETAEERAARMEEQQNRQANAGENAATAGNADQQNRQQAAADMQPGDNPQAMDQQETDQQADAAGAGQTWLVGDLLDMDVIGANGDDLGEPDAIIERDGRLMLVISDGGFLGLGADQTAVPMERVSFNAEEEELRLQQLSADELDEARTFEYDASEEVNGDRQIRVN